MMNGYRLVGDVCLVMGTPIMAWKAYTQGSAEISLTTHLLRALMFATRYIDVFTAPISTYNTAMKCILVANSVAFALFLSWQKYSEMGFKRIAPAAATTASIVLCCLFTATRFTYQFNPVEIMWSFSRILSISSEIPQLIVVSRTPKWEVWTRVYYVALVEHVIFYGANWVHRKAYEGFADPISVACGLAQLAVIFGFSVASQLRSLESNNSSEACKVLFDSKTEYPVDKKGVNVVEEAV